MICKTWRMKNLMQWILYKKGFQVPQIENSILEEFKEKVNHNDFVLPFVLFLRSLSYFQSRENEWGCRASE